MKNLMAKIKEDKKTRGISNKDIAALIKVSDTQVSRYLNSKDRTPFFEFIKILELVYGNEVSGERCRDRFVEFVEVNSRKENDRIMLEWLSQQGENDLLRVVINRAKADDYYPMLGNIYEILLKRKEKTITNEDFYFKSDALKTHFKIQDEETVMVMIASIYSNWGMGCYKLVDLLAERATSEIMKITDEYLRRSYTIRVQEMQMYSALKQNRINHVVEIAHEIISVYSPDEFPYIINSAYVILAEVHRDQFEISMKYICESMNLSADHLMNHKLRDHGIKSTHDFVKISNNEFSGLFLQSDSDAAYMYAKTGNKQACLQILHEIEKGRALTPYEHYYKGIALQDKVILEKAFEEFVKAGDLFYAKLPLKAMEELHI
ncbi:AimR family lysis-lysogeny pheromone receptor [Rossellomorea marisflavi]|uniref:AimR family lysis-lysogeny pheromone receptor n=1 Tax=Rossellomorea marisflavi TaxID=189381 RepID=UPI003D2EF3AA